MYWESLTQSGIIFLWAFLQFWLSSWSSFAEQESVVVFSLVALDARQGTKCCLTGIAWVQHSWTHSSCHYPYRIKTESQYSDLDRGRILRPKPISLVLLAFESRWRRRERDVAIGELPMLWCIVHTCLKLTALFKTFGSQGENKAVQSHESETGLGWTRGRGPHKEWEKDKRGEGNECD